MIPRADAMGRELVLPPYHTIDTENDTIKFHFTGQVLLSSTHFQDILRDRQTSSRCSYFS